MSFDRGLFEAKGERSERVRAQIELEHESGLDPEMQSALRNFRRSVHAWSDASNLRTRSVAVATQRPVLRVAAAWTLAGLLIAGGVGGGFLVKQHRQEQVRLAAEHDAELRRQLREERTREAEQELAQVDRDISRQVPDALEPLARLMTEDESQ
jgi:hypothetical protein